MTSGAPAGEPEELYGEAYFDTLADWHRRSYPTFAAFVAAALRDRPPGRILDLGCGAGTYAAALRPHARHLTGCDRADAALERAAAAGYDRLIGCDLDRAVAADLGGPYEVVFSTEVVEHLDDAAGFFATVGELLVPGGRLLLTTTAYHFYLFYYLALVRPRRARAVGQWLAGFASARSADRFVERLWRVTGGHRHGFARHRLRAAARAAGLRVDRCRHVNVQPVVPVPELVAASPRALRPAVALAGRAVNAACRRTGLYGPNLLLAATRPR